METSSCVICLEICKKHTIDCVSCNAIYHQKCYIKSVESTSEITKCMNCDKHFSVREIYEKLNKNNTNLYRKIVANIDIEKEKNLLPIAQSYIEDCKTADILCNNAHQIEKEIIRLQREADNLKSQAMSIKSGNLKVERAEKAGFICPCPGEKCNGFLSNKYICSLCETNVCRHCKVILNNEEEHKCNEDEVKSVDFIKKSTKPCPKCGTRIHRPGGCDHMFCTKPGCTTSFSWKTGTVIPHSKNTNPYYYEWRRTQPGGLPRVIEEDCELITTQSVIIRADRIITNRELSRLLQKIHHVSSIELEYYRGNQYTENRDLAVKFLTRIYDEKQWKTNVKRRRKKREMHTEIANVLEAYVESSTDVLRNYISISPRYRDSSEYSLSRQNDTLQQLKKLREMFQKEIFTVLDIFGSKAMIVI